MIKLTDLIEAKLNVSGAGDLMGFVLSGWIPLTPSIMKRLNISKKIKAVHGSNDIGLSWLDRIEGSKKAISAATKWNNDFLTKGVGTEQFTWFTCLEGISVASFPGDVFSAKDSNGRRWIGMHVAKNSDPESKAKRLKISQKIDKMVVGIVDKMAKKYKLGTYYDSKSNRGSVERMLSSIRLKRVYQFGYSEDKESLALSDKELKKLQSEIVSLYMSGIEKELGTSDFEWIIQNSGAVGNGGFGTGGYGWDEVILTNIKIKKVYTTRDFVKADHDKNRDMADKYPQLKKLKFDVEYVEKISDLDKKLKKWVGK